MPIQDPEQHVEDLRQRAADLGQRASTLGKRPIGTAIAAALLLFLLWSTWFTVQP